MKKSDQIVLIYAHADLCGALEEHIHNNNKEYVHCFTFGFSVKSTDSTGEDTNAHQLRAAILTRLAKLSDEELVEACVCPEDTYLA